MCNRKQHLGTPIGNGNGLIREKKDSFVILTREKKNDMKSTTQKKRLLAIRLKRVYDTNTII